jgi:hypothetical protein
MEELRDYINEENLIKDETYKSLKISITCPICFDIFIEPMKCEKCNNIFCKKCLERWSREDKRCPNRCESPNYKRSPEKEELFSQLTFKCKKCKKIIKYSEMERHNYLKCGTEKNSIKLYDLEKERSFKGIFEKLENKEDILLKLNFSFKSK